MSELKTFTIQGKKPKRDAASSFQPSFIVHVIAMTLEEAIATYKRANPSHIVKEASESLDVIFPDYVIVKNEAKETA